jgi:SpoVK/Ycf46/Vps4 family AAA+-type ATPase
VGRFLANSSGLFLLGTSEAWPELMPAASVVDVARPTPAEQQATWLRTLGSGAGQLAGQLAGQFAIDVAPIGRIARTAAGHDASEQLPRLWDASAAICRPRMDALAQRIDSRATWDDLVLPEPELGLLHQIADQVRHRADVYTGGGFGERLSRGLGITALFAGPSGTGKTMAAEVLARDLRLSLYRIDLSAVVSKYIGETEKNLRRVFEAAEQGAAVLFFDEADALFGKRSEVKDSHDRYANIEVNYLLQRMESYRGVAVLATNMRSALDQAFLRRLRFVVTFPFPAADERRIIWSKVFPSRTQTAGLDLDRLAGLTATGGMINNIALNAAFLAARDATPVTMPLVLQAARAEFRKLELPVSEGDFAWQPEVVR